MNKLLVVGVTHSGGFNAGALTAIIKHWFGNKEIMFGYEGVFSKDLQTIYDSRVTELENREEFKDFFKVYDFAKQYYRATVAFYEALPYGIQYPNEVSDKIREYVYQGDDHDFLWSLYKIGIKEGDIICKEKFSYDISVEDIENNSEILESVKQLQKHAQSFLNNQKFDSYNNMMKAFLIINAHREDVMARNIYDVWKKHDNTVIWVGRNHLETLTARLQDYISPNMVVVSDETTVVHNCPFLRPLIMHHYKENLKMINVKIEQSYFLTVE